MVLLALRGEGSRGSQDHLGYRGLQATQAHPDCPESEVLWDFLDSQDRKDNLDRQAKRAAKVTVAQKESV